MKSSVSDRQFLRNEILDCVADGGCKKMQVLCKMSTKKMQIVAAGAAQCAGFAPVAPSWETGMIYIFLCTCMCETRSGVMCTKLSIYKPVSITC